MRAIRDIESKILSHPRFATHRRRTKTAQLVAPNSITPLFFPQLTTNTAQQDELRFDGNGTRLLALNLGLQMVGDTGAWGYFDRRATLDPKLYPNRSSWYDYDYEPWRVFRAQALGSWLEVGLPLPGYTSPSDRRTQQLSKLNDLFVTMVPFVRGLSDQQNYNSAAAGGSSGGGEGGHDVAVYCEGLSTSKAEFEQTLLRDLRLVGVSVAFVFCYLALHLRSIVLACVAMGTLLLGFPPGNLQISCLERALPTSIIECGLAMMSY
jgi:hypothetical protein